ncbi:hypothetical protein J5Y04_13790 [Kitasatospora sp. RG8]|uniref:hypothetical protein n=1 Tax=Kitasatospora sp. RG8 TaxID=2820815 RepID=UPI001ADF1C2E|nr:hypothetical protein [Kitasatospora sp. RG8]MBP0450608.1 hypothetical protein [Kitasatospora sp. RG8]
MPTSRWWHCHCRERRNGRCESPSACAPERVEVVERAARTLGFTPGLRMTGLLDVTVPPAIADDAQEMYCFWLAKAISATPSRSYAGIP